MFSLIKRIVYLVLSYTPILSITKDRTFGTNKERFIENHKIIRGTRFSVLNIHFGKMKVYIFTYILLENGGNRFDFIKVLDLEKLIMPHGFTETYESKAKEYEMHYRNLEKEEKSTELQFIKYKLDCEKERSKKSEYKMNLYTSIVLVLIPAIIVLYKPEKIYGTTFLVKTLYVFLIICVINTILFIFHYTYVKTTNSSTFSDIKNSGNKTEQSANNYYFDWQMIKIKADLDVSYVKNIQYFIAGIIIISIMLYFCSFVDFNKSSNINNNDSVYTINVRNLESKYSKDAEKVSEIHKILTDIHPKEIILIYGQDVDTDNFNRVYNQFDIYKDIKIYKIIDNDYEEKETIKVIIKGE